MNRYSVLFTILSICVFAGFAGSTEIVPVDPMAPPEMQSVLVDVTNTITSTLDSVQEANRISAESMGKTGISGTLVTEILTEKLANITYGHSSLVISPKGIVTAAAPDHYSDLIGKDLLYQDEVQYAIAEKQPVMSDLFPMEEGFSGISVTYPIFSDPGIYLGYTDVTIIPDELLSRIIVPVLKDTGMEVFVIQDDGLTLYETNPEEIGRNISTDPLYDTPTMQAVGTAVLTNENGTIQYTFWNTEWNRQVPREATWTTLHYGGQEWRIGVIRNQNESDQSASATNDPVSDPVE